MSTSQDEIDGPVTKSQLRGGAVRVPRTRGALSGVMLMVLGAWGALIPFIGPYFNFSYTPDTAWHWSAARGWLEVLPGVVAFVGGLLTFMSSNRVTIMFGAWIGVLAGAWFVIGRDMANWLKIGSPGTPAGTGTTIRTLETLALFSALGAVIVFFGANAVGRLSVRSVNDVRAAQRRETRKQKAERQLRDSAYEQGHRDGLTEAEQRAERDRTEAPATGQLPVGAQNQGNYPAGGYPQQSGYPAAPPAPETTTTDQGAHVGPPPRA